MQTDGSFPIARTVLLVAAALAVVVFLTRRVSRLFIQKMSSTTARPFPWRKRLAALFLLLGIIIFSVSLGFLTTSPTEVTKGGTHQPGIVMLITFLGSIFWMFVALGVFGLAYVTDAMTFSFQRPIWNGFRRKLFVFNLCLVFALLGMTVSAMMCFEKFLLLFLGMNFKIPDALKIVTGLFFWQITLSVIPVWSSVAGKSIRKRLLARGLGTDALEKGRFIGISFPGGPQAIFKYGMEDDIGVLWIEDGRLRYIGDQHDYEIMRDDLISISRMPNAASIASYAGVLDVIVTIRTQDGAGRQIHFYPGEFSTLFMASHRYNDLADRLNAWKGKISQQDPTTGTAAG